MFAASKGPSVGCQLNAFPLKPGDLGALIGALEEIAKMNYAGFECNIRFVKPFLGELRSTRERIGKTGMTFVGAHTSMDEAADSGFADAVKSVAALGVKTIVMSGKGLANDGNFSSDDARKKAAALDGFGRLCVANKIRLSYHNHNPEFANHNAEMEALARFTNPELVSFLMDAGHAHLGGGDPAAFLSAHAKRVFGIHLKTFRGKEMTGQQPLGRGDFDFEDVAAAVKKTQWSGWLIDEEGGGPIPGNFAALPGDREHIRQLFGR